MSSIFILLNKICGSFVTLKQSIIPNLLKSSKSLASGSSFQYQSLRCMIRYSPQERTPLRRRKRCFYHHSAPRPHSSRLSIFQFFATVCVACGNAKPVENADRLHQGRDIVKSVISLTQNVEKNIYLCVSQDRDSVFHMYLLDFSYSVY